MPSPFTVSALAILAEIHHVGENNPPPPASSLPLIHDRLREWAPLSPSLSPPSSDTTARCGHRIACNVGSSVWSVSISDDLERPGSRG
ncbi:hypothetical protein N7462_007598 [Penicillium macrosclerotiorum]|uniref:uncharacterized protein n=1 Tax=Penicillium macrosclerotiorum TaxID=303699 RepID=UPI0025477D65|nr:uncharacterized protein N7462_007598 [Penicillium macrosclerotiorum]KAJ5679354.1 hypothetical protein N7462_007598 [Penicillium macrosclerotiorum]